MPNRTVQITPKGIAGSIAVFVVAALCVRLGFWQLDRLGQRQAYNAALAARMHTEPLVLGGAPADTTGLRFRRVTASGTWDGERSIVLPGRSHRGTPGGYVLTPLRLDDGTAVLVLRGWAPAADGATVPPDALEADGSQSVTGTIDAFPGQSQTLAPRADSDAITFRRVWYAIDEPALRGQFPYVLANVMIRMEQTEDARRLPIALEPPPLDEGPHLGYAIQWFSFAAIALIGWVAMLLRRRD
jgi:surfeit locus 1 family protein